MAETLKLESPLLPAQLSINVVTQVAWGWLILVLTSLRRTLFQIANQIYAVSVCATLCVYMYYMFEKWFASQTANVTWPDSAFIFCVL